jgi:hypothetical protein
MTPEEYQRIKEAEKQHLRALKKLKEKLREVERQKSVARALEEIQKAPGEDILNTHEEMIDRLAFEAVEQEARLEVAMSEAGELDSEEIDLQAEQEKSDAELQKIRAQDLVRQIKIQMGMSESRRKQDPAENVTTSEPGSPRAADSTSTASGASENPTTPGTLPEKTIGRIPRKRS